MPCFPLTFSTQNQISSVFFSLSREKKKDEREKTRKRDIPHAVLISYTTHSFFCYCNEGKKGCYLCGLHIMDVMRTYLLGGKKCFYSSFKKKNKPILIKNIVELLFRFLENIIFLHGNSFLTSQKIEIAPKSFQECWPLFI